MSDDAQREIEWWFEPRFSRHGARFDWHISIDQDFFFDTIFSHCDDIEQAMIRQALAWLDAKDGPMPSGSDVALVFQTVLFRAEQAKGSGQRGPGANLFDAALAGGELRSKA